MRMPSWWAPSCTRWEEEVGEESFLSEGAFLHMQRGPSVQRCRSSCNVGLARCYTGSPDGSGIPQILRSSSWVAANQRFLGYCHCHQQRLGL